MVASSLSRVRAKVMIDGEQVAPDLAGTDVGSGGILEVKDDRLYKIIESNVSAEHTLELEILDPGLKTFTFTFG